ncbi:hypothetical protein ANN_12539 [Periplaneta americana]|uniref:Endonuclease-reverse transcriptase n=1 Tax=Periplaneta americana TaxID=6978 RepID=A0ABQ8TGX5_PERAM|nr:hypothetical protein ANN_12539 [Periplaneta americana]
MSCSQEVEKRIAMAKEAFNRKRSIFCEPLEKELRGYVQLTTSKEASLVYRSSTRVCVRNCVSSRRPEFECSGPQLEGPEFECSGPQLEGPEFEYSELSLKMPLQSQVAVTYVYHYALTVNWRVYINSTWSIEQTLSYLELINDDKKGICKHHVRSSDRSQWIEVSLHSAMEHVITEDVNCFKASQACGIPYRTWFRERHCDDTPLAGQRQIQIERSLTPVSERWGLEDVGSKRNAQLSLRARMYSRLRWAGYVARMGESRNAYRGLVGRPEGKRPLGRPRRRWKNNIKIDLGEVGYDGRDWINLAQDRDRWRAYVRTAMNLREKIHKRLGKNTEILLEASEAIGLEVNPEKTKYMIMSRDQNIVRNGNIKIGDLSFEGVEKFKYLGATITNINDTREEIKHRINMGNACYYSVEKLLSSSLLSKNLKVRIYKTVILPVVLYGCETWTLTLREEHRLRVFGNKVLRKIFGAKRDEVIGEWRKLHNAEMHALYSSPDIIRNIKSRRLRWTGHVARMGESRNGYRVLVGRPEGKRRLGRPRRRWEDNIKIDLREVGYDDRDWINLAQDSESYCSWLVIPW